MAVVVTGGNAGIGLALCRQLVEQGVRVFMCSRSLQRGKAAVDSILSANPKCVGLIELVQMDVTSDQSVQEAAAYVQRNSAAPLYGLVNNAGTGLGHRGVTAQDVINTNLYGTKRVSEAFIPLLHPTEGRIVNVGSGAGPMWLRNQPSGVQTLLSSFNVTWAAIEQLTTKAMADAAMKGYGLSKACVHAYSMALAREHPSLLTMSISPGYIATAMCPGGSKPPDQGTVSIRHCLFANRSQLGNGFYYGSDGKRSPLTRTRDPGTPEYRGD